MDNQEGNQSSAVGNMDELAAENKALREEIACLHSTHQANTTVLQTSLAIERDYHESQTRFKTIFEQSSLGNKIIASDLRIIRVNNALTAMLGYSKAELEGTRILDYVRADYEKPLQELQENLWTKQIPSFRIETVLVRKDGSLVWCSVNSVLFRDGEETLGYTILEDITGRKTLEARLQKMYDAQETVMHTVAHDLKNPVHTIKTLTGFLTKEMGKLPATGSPEQSLTFINMIGQACEKVYAIINDLLLIGQMESPHSTFRKQTTHLNPLLAAQLSPFGVTAGQKGVTFRAEVPSEPVLAAIYPEKFARVVDNLLSNAVKFTPEGGVVTVSLREEARKVILKVTDTGVGIPAHLQESVFDKFTRANRRGTGGEATTGLGLFIARQIVELHGGRIWLESNEGEGTAFFVELPKE